MRRWIPALGCRPSLAIALSLALAAAGASGLSGCKKNGATASGQTDPALVSGDYIALYEARRYSEAKSSAEYRLPNAKGREREVAKLTAGLSAYAMGQDDAALQHLQPLTASTDKQIAGRAEAALGQIAQRRGQHTYAADLFKRASAKLDGDDAARAAVRAGNSLAALGKQSEATTQYKQAASEATSAAVRDHANKMTEPGPFALQAGVYTTRANADKRARELTPLSTKMGYGSPKVVPDSVNGKPAYAVRVGVFANRQQANTAKDKMRTSVVVVQAD